MYTGDIMGYSHETYAEQLEEMGRSIARLMVQNYYRISDDAWSVITRGIWDASCTPLEDYSPDRTRSSVRVEGLRPFVRNVAAVFSRTDEEAPRVIDAAVSSWEVGLRDWQEILKPRANELPLSVIRDMASCLREGYSAAYVSEKFGVSQRQSERLVKMLGTREWLRDRDVTFACDQIEYGATAQEAYGLLCESTLEPERPSWSTFQRRWKEAQKIMGTI
jgi:hypothetical protein